MNDVGFKLRVYCDVQCKFNAIYNVNFLFKKCIMSPTLQPQKQQ